jgi:hypothetical protein
MNFIILNAQFNFSQTLLIHFLRIDNFWLLNVGLKFTPKKFLDSERASGEIYQSPMANKN